MAQWLEGSTRKERIWQVGELESSYGKTPCMREVTRLKDSVVGRDMVKRGVGEVSL